MKHALFGIAIALGLAAAIFIAVGGKDDAPQDTASAVVFEDGRQIVTIVAKGGYRPASTSVKAGVPTTLRVKTSGTFDCSSIIAIPSLRIERSLPPTGVTDIDLGTLEPGALQGTCGMGMYRFTLIAAR